MRRFYLLLCTLLLMLSNSVLAQSNDCTIDALPSITVGLVFPSDSFLMPNRVDFYRGAVGMLETMNQCSTGNTIEWIEAYAEDYEGAIDAAEMLATEHDVRLIIGGGSTAVSDGLANAARDLDIILWETTEGLTSGGHNAFSVTNSNFQRGLSVADFVRNTYGEEASIALIYNERERSTGIAQGIQSVLGDHILIKQVHAEYIPAAQLALDIRRQEIDVVILVTFQTVADSLWRSMRDADANVEGWLNVGDPGYRFGLCNRIGESDGLITIHRFAMTNPDNDIFDEFATYYQTEFGKFPTERAHLTASGVYMLLSYVLPQLDDNPSTDAIRDAIYNATADMGDGLMGEGLSVSAESGSNELASLVVQQNQSGTFCTASPSALATCSTVEEFSSWRDRAIMQDEQGCTEPWADPDL